MRKINMKILTNNNFEAVTNSGVSLVDFYADWCIPCKELDKLTFADKNVINESKFFTFYKVDMTKSDSEKNEELRKKFNILGSIL